MPGRKAKRLASTTTQISCNSCNYCGRVFSGKNKKLITKLITLHTKKCMEETPKLSVRQYKIREVKIKNQLDSLAAGMFSSAPQTYIGKV